LLVVGGEDGVVAVAFGAAAGLGELLARVDAVHVVGKPEPTHDGHPATVMPTVTSASLEA
jgi:hypothetical protein